MAPESRLRSERGGIDVSIIIVNRNTKELLRACLGSIRLLPDAVKREVIVVDNGSTDGSLEMLEKSFPIGIRLIRNETNTGFAFPNNQGIRASRGRYILLLNSDTEVRAGALDRMVRYMDDHLEAGACGPLLRYPDGREQPSWFSFQTPWRVFCDMVGLAALFPNSRLFANQERLFDASRVTEVETLMGAALMVRRSVVQRIGLIDEQFSVHCNEMDWCYRMHLAHDARVFLPDAEVMHHLGATLKAENRDYRLQSELLRNLFDYIEKHHGRKGVLWFRFWTAFGYGMRLLVGRGSEAVRRFRRGMWNVAISGDPARFV